MAGRHVEFQRLTDFSGMKEAPALSPDGKIVAFVAFVGGRRQILIRLLAGGAPLQVTRDDSDHEHPRWAPDSSTLIYYTPSGRPGEGTIWEISALGGPPRRVASAMGGGDISHDGQRIALVQSSGESVELDGGRTERLAQGTGDAVVSGLRLYIAPLVARRSFDCHSTPEHRESVQRQPRDRPGQQRRAPGSDAQRVVEGILLAARWLRPRLQLVTGKHHPVPPCLQRASRLDETAVAIAR